MRILIAPDSYKESMSAREAAEAIARGVRRAASDCGEEVRLDICPISDGGAGFVDAVLTAMGGARRTLRVEGPLGQKVEAEWGSFDADDAGGHGTPVQTAVFEASSAFGFHLVPLERRDPTTTSSFGVGELLHAGLSCGCRRILMGIGNSSTCDAGVGMARALGFRFSDADGVGISRPVGADLSRIVHIEADGLDSRIASTEIVVACDVRNGLLGPDGTAPVFGPQKGATRAQVSALEDGLTNLVRRCAEAGLECDAGALGTGAAGGMGFGLATFVGARLEPGAGVVLDALGFESRVANADLLVTGEGCLDSQSLLGKGAIEAGIRAARAGVPAIALVGRAGDGHEGALREGGGVLHEIHELSGSTEDLNESIRRGAELLEARAAEVVGSAIRAMR